MLEARSQVLHQASAPTSDRRALDESLSEGVSWENDRVVTYLERQELASTTATATT
jgi:hypothetical protein